MFATVSLTTPDDWRLAVRLYTEFIEDEFDELTDWVLRSIINQ